MAALEHFAKIDAHASQYAMISKSLLTAAVSYLEKKEAQERLQRTESSAQLFGLIPSGATARDMDAAMSSAVRRSPDMGRKMIASPGAAATPGFGFVKDREAMMGDAMLGSGGNMNSNNNNNNHPTSHSIGSMGSPFFGDLDPAFLSMSNTIPRTPDLSLMSGVFDGDEASFGGLNLFPLLDNGGGGGHIDLAHYL